MGSGDEGIARGKLRSLIDVAKLSGDETMAASLTAMQPQVIPFSEGLPSQSRLCPVCSDAGRTVATASGPAHRTPVIGTAFMFLSAVRRVGGTTMAAVGVVGVALSVYLVGQIGWTAYRIANQTPAVVRQLERVVDSLQQRSLEASDVVQATRDRLQSVRDTVAGLPTEGRNAPSPAVLATVNVEIVASLERAEDFVRSMQTNLESARGALLLLESIPFLGASFSKPVDGTGQSNLKTLASGLAEISTALSQGAGLLAEIRLGRGIEPAQIARLQEALEQVDVQLLQIHAEIDRFSEAISDIDHRLDKAEAQIQQRVRLAAGMSIALLVCFGFGQLNLILQGLRLLRRGPSAAAA